MISPQKNSKTISGYLFIYLFIYLLTFFFCSGMKLQVEQTQWLSRLAACSHHMRGQRCLFLTFRYYDLFDSYGAQTLVLFSKTTSQSDSNVYLGLKINELC